MHKKTKRKYIKNVTSDYLWGVGYGDFYFFFESVYVFQVLFNQHISL